MILKVVAQKISSQIDTASNILLVGHKKADGDALGSLCAMAEFLQNKDKNYLSFTPDSISNQYLFLPIAEQVTNDLNKVKEFKPDLIIVLDTSDLRHAGISEAVDELSKPVIINIDHHPTNDNYGDINYVDSQAVATSEIIYNFFQVLNFTISRDIATCLLTGILFDTNNFTNPNTTFESLDVASKLLRYGASLPQVNDYTLKNKSLPTLQLWGKVLLRLKHNPDLNIVTTIITKDDLQEHKLDPDVADGLANFLNNLSGVNASIILREEEDNTIKGSMRTNNDFIDLAKLAKMLGGGGHRKAAGFTVNGRIVETEKGWEIV